MSEIIEAVSAQVHEDWMGAKRLAGVTSRKSESGEELMVPYAQLSEAAKDLDRGTVRSVLNTLPILGYTVTGNSAGCTCVVCKFHREEDELRRNLAALRATPDNAGRTKEGSEK